MGRDNQLLTFIRDGDCEGISIAILDSPRSLQLQEKKSTKHAQHVNDSQTRYVKIDRDTATLDRERVRARRRYSGDIDVRYMSWKSLKDKLFSSYSCDQKQCPMIRQRLIRHHKSVHEGRCCKEKCAVSPSKTKNCVSIRAGPDYDQYSDEKCTNCPMTHISNDHLQNNRKQYPGNCLRPIKGNLKCNKRYVDGCTSPSIVTSKVNNEQCFTGNCFNEYIENCTSPCNIIPKVKNERFLARNCLDNYAESCTSPCNTISKVKNEQCFTRSGFDKYAENWSSPCNIVPKEKNAQCFANNRFDEFAESGTSPYDMSNIRNRQNPAKNCFDQLSEACTSPCSALSKVKNEQYSTKNHFDEYAEDCTSRSNTTRKVKNEHSFDKNRFDQYAESCTSPCNALSKVKNQQKSAKNHFDEYEEDTSPCNETSKVKTVQSSAQNNFDEYVEDSKSPFNVTSQVKNEQSSAKNHIDEYSDGYTLPSNPLPKVKNEESPTKNYIDECSEGCTSPSSSPPKVKNEKSTAENHFDESSEGDTSPNNTLPKVKNEQCSTTNHLDEYTEDCTLPCKTIQKVKNEQSPAINHLNKYIDTSVMGLVTKNARNNQDAAKYVENTNINLTNNNSKRSAESRSPVSHKISTSIPVNSVKCYCDLPRKSLCTDRYTGNNISYNNTCTDCYDPNHVCHCNVLSNGNYANGCYCPPSRPDQKDCTDNYTTYSCLYINSKEAPKYVASLPAKNIDEDYQPSTSKNCEILNNCTKDVPTNTPVMVDNGSICTVPSDKSILCKKLFAVDEDSNFVMSSILNIVNNKKDSKIKLPETAKYIPNMRNIESSSAHLNKIISSYVVDKSSNSKSESKLSINNTSKIHKRSSYTNSIYREVKEWIREVPMYSSFEKEANFKNIVVNDLVKKLYKLFEETINTGNDEKVRNEIEVCLKMIPIRCPGDQSEQNLFRQNLIDRLTQRLNNLIRKNPTTDYKNRKLSKNSVAQVHTSLMLRRPSFNHQNKNSLKDMEIKMCVIGWLRLMISKLENNKMLKQQLFTLADFVASHVNTLFNNPVNTSNLNILLKSMILKIIIDLPNIIDCPIKNYINVQEFANNLTDKMLSIQKKYSDVRKHSDLSTASRNGNAYVCQDKKEVQIYSTIRECFNAARLNYNNSMIEKAINIFNSCYSVTNFEAIRLTRNKIMNLLINSTNLSKTEAWNLTKIVVKKVSELHDEGKECEGSQTQKQFHKSSIFTSINEANPIIQTYSVTSTPNKNKEVLKLNSQETQYMEDVANLIREWMTTLPESFSDPDEEGFKETMIQDLAGDIMDDAKLDQLVPDPDKDKRKIQKYIVYRWIVRLGAFEIQDVEEEIENFLDNLQKISIPLMTRPQRGNRQVMENLKFCKNSKLTDNFVPKGIDVLEDEISIWMHNQPSNIFTENDEKLRQNNIHNLAQVLKNKTGVNGREEEISEDIGKWLNQIVKPEKRGEINDLSKNLKDRLIDLPQDAALADIAQKRSRKREEHRQSKFELANTPRTYINDNEAAELDNTMANFISKFIERHYDIDDPLARRAFNRLLNGHLIILSPPIRKELNDKFEDHQTDIKFPPNNVIKELEYIKDISDWLKNLPVDAEYNTVGNRERVDFINSLALSIREIEEDRVKNPGAIDYDTYMAYIIVEHMKLLPIPKEFEENTAFMIGQLFEKIIAHRQDVIKAVAVNESIDTSGVNSDNIGDFIEEFIKMNGHDIAHDEVKMEAWAVRLIREIKRIIFSACPSKVSKDEICNKLMEVSIPSDETVYYFNVELDYVSEISTWMKNLPLLPMNEEEKDRVTEKNCELAIKLVETERIRISNQNKDEIDKVLYEYIEKWILDLQLDQNQEISLPILIKQLTNRIEKLKQKDMSLETKVFETKIKKSSDKKSLSATLGSSKRDSDKKSCNLTDAIEKWSQALPIKTENNDDTKNMQNDISRKIFQEVGQLNMNPVVNNNDIVYKYRLEDTISNILENVPQNKEFLNKKNKLKDDIVNTIVNLKNNAREKTAGNTYKLELEKTIDSSMPNPISCHQVYDPGFEIYKERLAAAFILENFDHSVDVVKTKYQMLLKKEIDNYFDHARNRNAIPLSRDRLYNELYSSLYKVQIPNEASVMIEVEKVKTRCEVDAWYEELPLQESVGLSELLDCEKLLAMLTTRIYEIETSDSKPSNKILKETNKILRKLPLLPGNECKYEEFAKRLIKRLKSTTEQRKCVLEKNKNKRNKAKTKSKESIKNLKQCKTAQLCSTDKIQTENIEQSRNPRKNPADEIYNIVRSWCDQLPIDAKDLENAQLIKDDLTTKIIVKVSELNSNPQIFHNDVLYDELLGKEFQNLLSNVSTSCNFCNIKMAKVNQLAQSIKSIKPYIIEEMASHKYRQDLMNNYYKVLEKCQASCPGKRAYMDGIKNDIVDDFILYKYDNKDDDENKQYNKINLQENVSKYILTNGKSNTTVCKNVPKINTLMKTNQLISELSKVSPKSKDILRDELEEIKMKNEISVFFKEIGITNKDVTTVNHLKRTLAKKLNHLELIGYNPENENKMKQEIMKCLKKLGKDKNTSVIDAFLLKLKNNEMDRRIPPNFDEFNETNLNNTINQSLRGGCKSEMSSTKEISGKSKRPPCPSKHGSKAFVSKPIDYNEICRHVHGIKKKFGRAVVNGNENEAILPLEDKQYASNEEESSSGDDSVRFCKKNNTNRYKRRHCCMMPVPLPLPLWCGMPLPLF